MRKRLKEIGDVLMDVMPEVTLVVGLFMMAVIIFLVRSPR
jgi:hypothetical protein